MKTRLYLVVFFILDAFRVAYFALSIVRYIKKEDNLFTYPLL